MENVFSRCAGLDVHKESVEACVRRMEPNGRLYQQTRHWGTMTRDLLAMADWMAAQGVTHVAMESTGVFWKPIYNLLEGRFTMLLVNARHLKQVPGRKSDVRDCQWIAQLLQYGLLKDSFIPPRSQRELRDLTRHRTQLVEERHAPRTGFTRFCRIPTSSCRRWPPMFWVPRAERCWKPCSRGKRIR